MEVRSAVGRRNLRHLRNLRLSGPALVALGVPGGGIRGSGRSACMPSGFGYIGRVVSDNVLRQAARFHGHLGPWLVLGLKAGAYARRKLAVSPFKLNARVFCPAGTPYTCFVDGIQFSSGCTMGKGNISHRPTNGCRAEFTRTDNRARSHGTDEVRCQKPDVRSQKCGPDRIRLTLRPEVWDELHSRPCRGMAGAARLGREFARRRLVELFLEQAGLAEDQSGRGQVHRATRGTRRGCVPGTCSARYSPRFPRIRPTTASPGASD